MMDYLPCPRADRQVKWVPEKPRRNLVSCRSRLAECKLLLPSSLPCIPGARTILPADRPIPAQSPELIDPDRFLRTACKAAICTALLRQPSRACLLTNLKQVAMLVRHHRTISSTKIAH
jgi:hypothetical protein